MSTVITYGDALASLLSVVAKHPQRVYRASDDVGPFDTETPDSNCIYITSGGTASCGVGRVLEDMNPAWLALTALDRSNDGQTLNTMQFDAYAVRLRQFFVYFTDKAIFLLRTFQQHQDSRLPWDVSLAKAITAVDANTSYSDEWDTTLPAYAVAAASIYQNEG